MFGRQIVQKGPVVFPRLSPLAEGEVVFDTKLVDIEDGDGFPTELVRTFRVSEGVAGGMHPLPRFIEKTRQRDVEPTGPYDIDLWGNLIITLCVVNGCGLLEIVFEGVR